MAQLLNINEKDENSGLGQTGAARSKPPSDQWVLGPGEVSFHSNPKERQCQRMLKLPHNCTHLTR